MGSRDFNEELGYSVINPGTVVGTEFALPGVVCGGVTGPGVSSPPKLGRGPAR